MVAVGEEEWGLVEGEQRYLPISPLTSAVIKGDFTSVLLSPACKPFLEPFSKAIRSQSTGAPLSLSSVKLIVNGEQAFAPLGAAVAALHAFIQANWTGPDLDESLMSGSKLLRRAVPDAFQARSFADDAHQNDDQLLDVRLQSASLDALTYAGEPAYHLCQAPFLLVFALRLLAAIPADRLETLSWWRLRAYSIHARLLDTPQLPPPELLASLSSLKESLRQRSGGNATADVRTRWGKLYAQVLIDEALSLQRAGREREANDLLLEATNASQLTYSLTGAPGKQTKFQKDDKMILVLLARSVFGEQEMKEAEGEDAQERDAEAEEEYDDTPSALPTSAANGWKAGPATKGAADMPSAMFHNDDTLLERTRFTSSASPKSTEPDSTTLGEADVQRPTALHPLDSCILLGLCLNIHNASPQNGLTASQMTAFVNRVLTHARNWSVHTMALLLRSRLEADRTRTAQRSALQLQALLDQMPTADSSVAERLRLVHELELPSKWEMQAELARRYATLGVLRSALEIFERIELWQEVVQCWGSLGRQDKGIEVVRDLLGGSKAESDHVISAKRERSERVGQQLSAARQAKLWCLLGDLEVSRATEHYKKAWEVSARRSARAARSLGGVTFAEGDYAKASLWLRRGLKIQPLYARSWFMLGCVYMRFDTTKAFIEAARCFRRCTALEDDDAESWNNLASCYLRLAQHSQGVLREAQLAQEADAQTDQRAVLQTLEQDGDTDGESSDVDSLHSKDSGVAVISNADSDTETETDDESQSRERQAAEASVMPSLSGGPSATGGGQGAFDVKMLAHRALEEALRLAYDDWRVWNNFMIVSVDCGMMNDAVRSLARVVELRGKALAGFSASEAAKMDTTTSGDVVDVAVLNRIVDGVIRAPSSVRDAVVGDPDDGDVQAEREGRQAQVQHNPNEGHGLWPAVRNLFEDVLLPRISSSADIWRCYARLLFWRGMFRAALNAHLSSWQASYGAEASPVSADRAEWLHALEALQELCELMENFGERDVHLRQGQELDVDETKSASIESLTTEPAMANWRFRARSLVRSFIGRTRDAFDGDQEWDRLVQLRESLSTSSA